MINKDKLKGFLAGVSLAVVLCSTTVFADNINVGLITILLETLNPLYVAFIVYVAGFKVSLKEA